MPVTFSSSVFGRGPVRARSVAAATQPLNDSLLTQSVTSCDFTPAPSRRVMISALVSPGPFSAGCCAKNASLTSRNESGS